VFDACGAITDEKVREQLKRFIHGFVGFVGDAARLAGTGR